jgi:hypothetical protein
MIISVVEIQLNKEEKIVMMEIIIHLMVVIIVDIHVFKVVVHVYKGNVMNVRMGGYLKKI